MSDPDDRNWLPDQREVFTFPLLVIQHAAALGGQDIGVVEPRAITGATERKFHAEVGETAVHPRVVNQRPIGIDIPCVLYWNDAGGIAFDVAQIETVEIG